jgi:DNA helicase-2/ATP-dependent DNA helicase PcrA
MKTVGDERDKGRYRLERTAEDQLPLSEFNWAAELNEQQLAAVAAPDGPVLVLAGAGSGKTRVITYRVAFLISERRVHPKNILLATFTNKAARSMLARCEQVVGPRARDVMGGTFHHVANLQLRRFARELGYENNFTILDESDARSVMKLSRSESGVDTKEKAFPSARLLCDIGSAVVNTNTSLDQLITARYPHLFELHDQLERVLIDYHERKRRSNLMDFDDLLVNLLRLLMDHPRIRQSLARRFIHVLVDEYQDVNHIQAAIVRELFLGEQEPCADVVSSSAERRDCSQEDELQPPEGMNDAGSPAEQDPAADAQLFPVGRGLFVVGDDAQSIYSFRGADYRNIRSFPQSFPGTRVYKLETNYRSVPQVLTLANGIMQDADPLFKKELRPVKPPGDERPLLLACQDADEQADFIAEQVIKLREDLGFPWRNMAVLYRAHNNRLEVELEFTKRNIPFIVRGGVRFFEQAHIKDVLSYLMILANSRDEIAWQRLLGMCTRVGPKTIARVLTQLRGATEEEGGLLGRFIGNGVLDEVRGMAGKSLKALREFLKNLHQDREKLPVPDLIKRVLDEQYRSYAELQFDNWQQRLEDIEQLVLYSNRFDTLLGFLADTGLSTELLGYRDGNAVDLDDREEGAVTLSTIHQAKGLEWKAVLLIHCQDDVLPHRMTRGDPDQEDEERRLLYVAVTRAKELLFMSFPQTTQTRDFQRIINRPSRFLSGLPEMCFDEAVLEWGGD